MTGEEFEKQCRVKHYRDLAGQAQEDRRQGERRDYAATAIDAPVRRLGADRRAAYQPAPVCECGTTMIELGGHGWACPEIVGGF